MPASQAMYFTWRIGMMMTSLGVSISRISMSSLMVWRITLLYRSSSLSVRTTFTQYSPGNSFAGSRGHGNLLVLSRRRIGEILADVVAEEAVLPELPVGKPGI